MKRILRANIVAALLGSGLLLAACNTVEGAGQDLESAGEAVEDAGDDGF